MANGDNHVQHMIEQNNIPGSPPERGGPGLYEATSLVYVLVPHTQEVNHIATNTHTHLVLVQHRL